MWESTLPIQLQPRQYPDGNISGIYCIQLSRCGVWEILLLRTRALSSFNAVCLVVVLSCLLLIPDIFPALELLDQTDIVPCMRWRHVCRIL